MVAGAAERKQYYCTRKARKLLFKITKFRNVEGIHKFISDMIYFVLDDYIFFMTSQLEGLRFYRLPANFSVEAEDNMTLDGKKHIFHFEISDQIRKEEEPYIIYRGHTMEDRAERIQRMNYYFGGKYHPMESWGQLVLDNK